MKKFYSKRGRGKGFAKIYRSEKNLVDVAWQLAELREAKGLTQAQLARKVSMTQSQIARIESGTNNVTVATVSRITEALDPKKSLQIA